MNQMSRVKSVCAVMTLACAPLAQADNGVNLDVSYLGGVASEASVEGDSYDTDLKMQGIKGAFYVPMTQYAFWQGSYDYSTDDPYGVKTEITIGKVSAGGRLPIGEQFSLKAYGGYASSDIAEDGSSGEESGVLFGVAADVNWADQFTLEAHLEQANLGDVTFQEAGINGYWYLAPTIAVGAGYKYRDFEIDVLGSEVGLDFGYVEAGLRISF